MSYASHAISISGGGSFPPLGQPSGLNVTGITTTGATLNWTAGLNAVSYIVYVVMPTGVQTTSGVFTTSITLSGLSPGTGYSFDVVSVGALGAQSPPSAPVSFTTQSTTSPYVFTYFISPLGNDTNDGKSAVQGTGIHGPWTLGSLRDPTSNSPTPQQAANNALMAGVAVGVVGDQGPLTFSGAGFSYPIVQGTGMALSVPSGTISSPTVLASCNSAGTYVQGLAVIDGQCNGTQFCAIYLLGRFSFGVDCQYITIDGLEVKNGMGGGIVLGQSGTIGTTLPGWVVKNCYVHHIYNCDEGFKATGCSQSGTTVTIGTVTSGFVNAGTNGINDTLWGTGFAGSLTHQVSGTPGGAGVYTSSSSATVVGPANCNGTGFAGNNTAGISFHGGSAPLVHNNFISDIIDLNTALAQNKRCVGIKHWTCINSVMEFNTIYASAATGYPTGGIEHKNVPQYNNVIQNNYIHLANAGPYTGVDVISIAGDSDGPGAGGHPIPAGSFYTINNNIIINNPNGSTGFPTVAGGYTGIPQFESAILNWYANTMIGSAGHASFGRFFNPGPPQSLNYYGNIIDRPTPAAGGNGGDWRTNVNVVGLIDFNLYPANYLMVSTPSAATSPATLYSASPPQNGGISGLMTALTTGSGGATTGLENNAGAGPQIGSPVYANASGTKLKASDWQLATGSPGQGKGRIGGVAGGTVVDMGAWGGQTQVGCNFRDPSG